jgi:hypothetical protein
MGDTWMSQSVQVDDGHVPDEYLVINLVGGTVRGTTALPMGTWHAALK